jgi:hypothetical protein
MSTDYNIKPVGAPVAVPTMRTAGDAVRDAVPTQLPPDKTVTAAPGVSHVNISPANYQQVDSDRISKGLSAGDGHRQAGCETVWPAFGDRPQRLTLRRRVPHRRCRDRCCRSRHPSRRS